MRIRTLTLYWLAFLLSSESALAAPKKKPKVNACEHTMSASMMQYDCSSARPSKPLTAEEKAVGRFVVDQLMCAGNPVCHAQVALSGLMGGYEPRHPQRVNINAGYTSQILEVPRSCAAAYAEYADPRVAIKIVPDAPGRECKPREEPPVVEQKEPPPAPEEPAQDVPVGKVPTESVPVAQAGTQHDGPPVPLLVGAAKPVVGQ